MAEPEEIEFSDSQAFVPAVYARSEEEAETYRELLEDHDIDVLVGYEEWEDVAGPDALPGKVGRGIPVLVPESFLDEASEIIADREGAEDDLLEDEEDDEEDDEEFGTPVELDGEGVAGASFAMDDDEEDEDEEEDDEDDYYDDEDDQDEGLGYYDEEEEEDEY